jgi:hypothetical protein
MASLAVLNVRFRRYEKQRYGKTCKFVMRASENLKNLARPNLYEFNLNAYYERVNAQAKALFWNKFGAFVELLESLNELNGQNTYNS